MDYLNLKGAQVPKLGLGTWQMSGEDCRSAVRDALELGYRHIDTAQMYGNEDEVGSGLADSKIPRDEVFVTTKVWLGNLEPDALVDSIGASLTRLDTPYADLTLIHWPSDEVPIEESLAALRFLQKEGRTRHIGVSNFTPTLLKQAASVVPIFCNQVEYHPFLGQTELLELVRSLDLMLTAYSPLARGQVNDSKVLRDIGAQHDKSPAQVALRWLVQQDRVAAIPKAETAEHRRANLGIFDFELTDEEMARIHHLDRGRRLIDPDFAPEWGR